MPDNEDLLRELIDKEINTMEIFLSSKASKLTITIEEYVQTRLLQGATKKVILEALLDDLDNNGRMFAEFRNAIRATSNGVVNRLRDNALFAEVGVDQEYRWVAVMVNTCPDCMARHGMIKSWESWEDEGLPRTGHTVCKENCRCVLLPADTTEINPIIRERK